MSFARKIVAVICLALASIYIVFNCGSPTVHAAGPASFNVVSVTGTAGSDVVVPVQLVSQGDITGFTFSLNFDPSKLSISFFSSPVLNPDVAFGADVPPGCSRTVNGNQAQGGQIGVFITCPTPFATGTRQVATFKFRILPGTPPGQVPIFFDIRPVPQSTSASGQDVQATYSTGFVTIVAAAAGFEGDINRANPSAPGPGDGVVNGADLTWYSLFAGGAHCPNDSTFNEFQKLDYNDNGLVDGGDYTAIFLVSLNLQPKVAAKGPATKPAGLCTNVPTKPSEVLTDRTAIDVSDAAAVRDINLISASGRAGSTVRVPVEINAFGNEANSAFSVHFDPTVLSISGVSGIDSNPDVVTGPGAAANQKIGVNATDVENGNIGLLVDYIGGAGQPSRLSPGLHQVVYLRFTIRPDAAEGTAVPLTFGDTPMRSGTFDLDGNPLIVNNLPTGLQGMAAAAKGSAEVVVLGASAGKGTISGRVTNPTGAGLRGITVVLSGSNETYTAVTNSLGYYQFDAVDLSSSYVIGASGKRYRFSSRTIQNTDNLADVNLVGQD